MSLHALCFAKLKASLQLGFVVSNTVGPQESLLPVLAPLRLLRS